MRGHLARFPTTGVLLTLDHSGLYRLTASYLLAHGVDITGISAHDLAIEHDGSPVPRLIYGGPTLGPDSSIEFVARAAPTRYSTATTYELRVEPGKAVRATAISGAPGPDPATTGHVATFVEARRTVYDPLAHGDPWFFTQITAAGAPAHAIDRFSLPGALRKGTAHFTFHLRGVSDEPGSGPQHHLVISVNGRAVAQIRFSGVGRQDAVADISTSLLRAASNTVRFTLPGNVQNADHVDSIEIASWAVAYPRTLRAERGALAALLPSSPRVVVSDLLSSAVEIWRDDAAGAVRLRGAVMQRRGSSFAVSFRAAVAGRYLVVSRNVLSRPKFVRALAPTSYLLRGPARLLVIAARDLMAPLGPLIAYHRTHGLSVKVVDVRDIYDRYSFGIPDPAAIRAYLAASHPILGFRNALLVGGDTFDYHRYLACNSRACPSNPLDKSWIPSLYVRDASDTEVPSDEALVEGPHGPFAGIGRIPAVSAGQVRGAVARTLALLHRRRSDPRTVFAAGRETAGNGFSAASDALISLLPRAYRVTLADTARSGHRSARKDLLAGINAGSLLVDFVGHGNLEQWDTSPSLLSNLDLPLLHNRSSPGVFLGWGCQTAYHVDPTDAPLNARLLFAHNGGAALTLGSTGFDALPPQLELATAFFREIFHDSHVTTIGGALYQASALTLHADPSAIHTVQSYELFGDPVLPLSLLR